MQHSAAFNENYLKLILHLSSSQVLLTSSNNEVQTEIIWHFPEHITSLLTQWLIALLALNPSTLLVGVNTFYYSQAIIAVHSEFCTGSVRFVVHSFSIETVQLTDCQSVSRASNPDIPSREERKKSEKATNSKSNTWLDDEDE